MACTCRISNPDSSTLSWTSKNTKRKQLSECGSLSRKNIYSANFTLGQMHEQCFAGFTTHTSSLHLYHLHILGEMTTCSLLFTDVSIIHKHDIWLLYSQPDKLCQFSLDCASGKTTWATRQHANFWIYTACGKFPQHTFAIVCIFCTQFFPMDFALFASIFWRTLARRRKCQANVWQICIMSEEEDMHRWIKTRACANVCR